MDQKGQRGAGAGAGVGVGVGVGSVGRYIDCEVETGSWPVESHGGAERRGPGVLMAVVVGALRVRSLGWHARKNGR